MEHSKRRKLEYLYCTLFNRFKFDLATCDRGEGGSNSARIKLDSASFNRDEGLDSTSEGGEPMSLEPGTSLLILLYILHQIRMLIKWRQIG